jgi:uncharacterized membrane protein YfcA
MPRALKLAVIGMASGAFSGLFGGGGGAVTIPLAGVALANAVPERALEVSFAMLQLFVASRLVRRALRPEGVDEA